MKAKNNLFLLIPLLPLFLLLKMDFSGPAVPPPAYKKNLSEYGFFKMPLAGLDPEEGVIPYKLNSPLFSDYAFKERFLYVPNGQKISYNDSTVLDFPEGTVLIKNFLYPEDFRKPHGPRKIIETRLLIRGPRSWKALPYVWNEEQTEAKLDVAGARVPVSWTHFDGSKKELEYVVPNANQCKSCHKYGGKTQPIGPTARQLNGRFEYAYVTMNQLERWQTMNLMKGLPEDSTQWPLAPVWDDPSTGSLDERARIYLDINCAHCHKADGPAYTSGLYLDIHNRDLTALGVNKPPIAAGRGSGGRQLGIVPGHPEKSILLYRMESADPGEMMPEVGRKMMHEEGVELIREWIRAMEVE